MKNGRLQCKDIPDWVVVHYAWLYKTRIATSWPEENPGVVESLVKLGIPKKLAQKKVEHLNLRGLLTSGVSEDYSFPEMFWRIEPVIKANIPPTPKKSPAQKKKDKKDKRALREAYAKLNSLEPGPLTKGHLSAIYRGQPPISDAPNLIRQIDVENSVVEFYTTEFVATPVELKRLAANANYLSIEEFQRQNPDVEVRFYTQEEIDSIPLPPTHPDGQHGMKNFPPNSLVIPVPPFVQNEPPPNT